MDTKFVRLKVPGGPVQCLALYPGLPEGELAALLGSVYQRTGAVIGFQDRAGTILPLTVVCARPDILLSTETYGILFSATDRPALTAGGETGSALAPCGTDGNDEDEDDDDEEEEDEVCIARRRGWLKGLAGAALAGFRECGDDGFLPAALFWREG